MLIDDLTRATFKKNWAVHASDEYRFPKELYIHSYVIDRDRLYVVYYAKYNNDGYKIGIMEASDLNNQYDILLSKHSLEQIYNRI